MADDLENIDPGKMPHFDVSSLGPDVMAHISAIETVLCMAGIATPEMLERMVAVCRQNFDQQLAKLRDDAIRDNVAAVIGRSVAEKLED